MNEELLSDKMSRCEFGSVTFLNAGAFHALRGYKEEHDERIRGEEKTV